MIPIYHYEINGNLIEETLENFLSHFSTEKIWQNDVYVQSETSPRFFFSEPVARKQFKERLMNAKRLNILRMKMLQKENHSIDELLIELE